MRFRCCCSLYRSRIAVASLLVSSIVTSPKTLTTFLAKTYIPSQFNVLNTLEWMSYLHTTWLTSSYICSFRMTLNLEKTSCTSPVVPLAISLRENRWESPAITHGLSIWFDFYQRNVLRCCNLNRAFRFRKRSRRAWHTSSTAMMNYSSPEERPVDVLPKLFVRLSNLNSPMWLIHNLRREKVSRENNNPSPTPYYIFLTNKLATTYQATDHDDASNNGVIPSHYERCRQNRMPTHNVDNKAWCR